MFQSIAPNIRKASCLLSDNETFSIVQKYIFTNQVMHYTSVPNIMKVINPLFMDDLREEYNAILAQLQELRQQRELGAISTTQYYQACRPVEKRCNKLLMRMSKMKFFDPACGSGNFLIITYKCLRLLEMDVLAIIRQCSQDQGLNFIDGSCITIGQFYGIELLDFPHEVAMLSLWLAEHQMNKKLHDSFGVNTRALPLHNITQIVCGNACRIDWNRVCPHTPEDEVFVFGNPPYLGYVLQDQIQKEDIRLNLEDVTEYKKMDYISCWFYKAAVYISGTKATAGLVSTNSITQGEQVALLWPAIFELNVHISYAYTSFKWSNNAKRNAGVTCVIIGLTSKSQKCKLYKNDSIQFCSFINPYLIATDLKYVQKTTIPISGFPTMQKGSQPSDDGNLILDKNEYESLLNSYPESDIFLRRYIGASEYIKNDYRYCLWIEDDAIDLARRIPEINARIEKVRSFRKKSTKASTVEWANKPHSFTERRYCDSDCIIVPSTSSENREYIPIGFLYNREVVSNSAFTIYDASTWLFGLLTSRMHMTWVKTVGGRLKTDYRYSAQLCYNTYPFPKISEAKKAEIEEAAEEVLITRENYPGSTLADLYDPDKMPQDLREAHARLDDIVESCYPGYPFANDDARLECLFKLCEKMTARKE